MDLGHPLGADQPAGDALTPADHLGVERVEAPRPFAHGPRVHDAADAGEITGERNPPEPAVREDVDLDVALVAAVGALGATEMGEERDLAEVGNALAVAERGGEQGVAPARVDQEFCARRERRSVVARRHRHAVGIERHRLHAGAVADLDALLRRVVEQQRVEVPALDLEGVVRPRLAPEEIERVLGGRLLVGERGAVLRLEAVRRDGRQRAHPVEDRHRRR